MNIEKTISEQAVSDILTPMLESQDRIVTEDVAPMFNAATGLDTPTASGTVTTTIEESRSVITAIIRKAWTAPLTMLGGASVLSSIAAAYTYLRNRLQGNETYGIPDRRSEISASSPLAANLALLNDRKISGVPEAADGISLVHLLNDTSAITELTDNTSGWTLSKDPLSTFPSVTKMQLGCKYMTLTKLGNENTEDLQLNEIEELYIRDTYGTASRRSLLLFQNEVLYLPKLKKLVGTTAWSGAGFVQDNNYVKKIIMPTLNYFMHGRLTGMISYCANLEEVDMGEVKALTPNGAYGEVTALFEECPKLIAVKVGKGFNNNLNLQYWSPTLDSSNLQQFLLNVRQYIMLRLATGTSLTLTLSPAVYKAVYGLDADYNVDPNALAQTASLGDLGIATEDLNEIEIAAGITTATKYATWLDTYRGAIYWNIGHA